MSARAWPFSSQTAGHALLYDTGPGLPEQRCGRAGRGSRASVTGRAATGYAADLPCRCRSSRWRRERPRALSGAPACWARELSDRARAEPCEAGSGWRWDGVAFEILHPAAGGTHPDDNAGSCVLRDLRCRRPVAVAGRHRSARGARTGRAAGIRAGGSGAWRPITAAGRRRPRHSSQATRPAT